MRRHAAVGLATAVMLLLPGTASAKTLLFEGMAKGDDGTTIRFTASDRAQRGDFDADRVSEILVYNQEFSCYDVAGNPVGAGGRDSYPYSSIEPIKVKGNGRFSGSYKTTVPTLGETHTLEFKGKIERGKATGTYESRESRAGIGADYCGDEEPVEWKAEMDKGDTARIVAAGDQACPPDAPKTATTCHHAETADLVEQLDPDLVLGLGDHQYDEGALDHFLASYDPTWGRFKEITRPALGAHEFRTPGADGYYTYFGPLAGPDRRGYYSFDFRDWHFVSLNSAATEKTDSSVCRPFECGPDSPQVEWLREDLEGRDRQCTIVYWHHPRYSDGLHNSDPAIQTLWSTAFNHDVELVLVGHDHDYQRFKPLGADGDAKKGGMREIVVGTGGVNLKQFTTSDPRSAVRDNTSFGVLVLNLKQRSYSWRFVPEQAGGFTDSGNGSCRS